MRTPRRCRVRGARLRVLTLPYQPARTLAGRRVTVDASNACSAQWFSGAGNIRCPSVSANANGFIMRLPSTRQEDGSAVFQRSFLVAPQNVFNGYISGVYPSFKV